MVDAFNLLQLVLRWLHFVGGFAWIGTILFLAVVFSPGLSRLDVQHRVRSLTVVARSLNHLLIASSMLSVVAGVALALIRSNLETGIFLSSQWGLSILTGAILALILLGITAGIILPILEHYSSDSEAPKEGSELLENKLRRWSWVGSGIGVAVLFFMALAVSPI